MKCTLQDVPEELVFEEEETRDLLYIHLAMLHTKVEKSNVLGG